MDVLARAAEQVQHQARLAKARQGLLINCIFAVGLFFSLLALIPTIVWFRADGLPWGKLIFLAVFTLFFGWAVVMWLTWPRWLKPRIVAYFARELEPYGGGTSAAFWRGRAVYLELAALEKLAQDLGVKPLSAFGFEDDFFEQKVQWHPAAEGLQTVAALRQSLDAQMLANRALIQDLDALAQVLHSATERGVDFCLVLRLTKSDSIQAVCTREDRQGRFW